MCSSFARWVKGLGISLFVILAITSFVSAQTQMTTGTIQGTVTDTNGAIVPGQCRNQEPRHQPVANSDDGRRGTFRRLALPPGPYSVTVSKQGFATAVAERLNLTIGQALNLPVGMKISGVEERVTITASDRRYSEDESSSTLNETTVSTTPILGRKFEDLLTLTPGVSVVQGPDGDEITFSGQRGVSTMSAWMAATITTGFSASSWAASARPSIFLWMQSRNFRSWRPAHR